MYKALITSLCVSIIYAHAENQNEKKSNGYSVISFHPPITTVSKQQLEHYVTIFEIIFHFD